MSDAEPESTNAAAAEAKTASARDALRTAEWISDEGQFRGGELPLWNRLPDGSQVATRRGRWLAGIGWCVVLVLAAIALLKIFWHDGAWPLILINAFTFYLYWPAYAVLAFALCTQRRALALASAAVVACHLYWIAPDLQPPRSTVSTDATVATDARSIRIYYANVQSRNRRWDDVLAEARSFDPDVIVLAEVHGWWWGELIRHRPFEDYPYGTDLDRRNAGDVGVFSRLPVQRFGQIPIAGRYVLALDLPLGDQTLRLFALHSPRPTPDSRDSYYQFWDVITGVVTEDQGHVVVIGDFNATQYSRIYRQLQDGGLRSAHEDRGRGLANTWPQKKSPFPLIRIDQAFLSPEVECVSIREGDAPGSDHRSLILDLLIRPASPSQPDR
jgi:endonuclease/exonuclease/phosphatase (EEP) superfamily protein YafD